MRRIPCLCLAVALLPLAALAQTPPTPPEPPASAASAPAVQLEAVEVKGTRPNDTQERRRSTAAKIIVGREEIEKFGDSTVGEVLKRLPGVTLQGAPGRGGAIRMRGLGSGYTQVLLDGERLPPGFSVDTLAPEQIERIEILRAPTAETGTRAIAGTINIIMREGFRKKLNGLRIGSGYENGRAQPNLAWTRNDTIDDLIYNLTASLYRADRKSESVTDTVNEAAGVSTADREAMQSHEVRQGLHASGRLQWRGENGNSAMLTPVLIYNETDISRQSRLTRTVTPADPAASAPYDAGQGGVDGRYMLLRLNGQWSRQLKDAGRMEIKSSVSQGRWDGRALRQASKDDGSPVVGNYDDINSSRDTSASAGTKYTTTLDSEHSLVSGLEIEGNRRSEQHSVVVADGDEFAARSLRLAAYTQDEWSLTPQWAVHAGLRWEGISTHSQASGGATPFDIANRSSVWSPLFHAVWKPTPKSRDQVRLSLTRSYRAPTLQNLIPSVRESASNSPTRPDRAGNPGLQPELATGLDVAIERYLPGSGILSANVFHRQISHYMRSVTSLEATRYVSRMQNVGDATTQGIELEAKFRLSELLADAPQIDFRANASVFHSRVKDVPGPDNRIDQQPGATANVGADYRLPGTPVTLGGNLNWTPGYTTRISESQWAEQGRKLVGDAYVLCFLSTSSQIRLTASNFAPRDYVTGGASLSTAANETSQTTATSYINWQLRYEMKL